MDQTDQYGPNQKWIERVEGTLGVPSSSDTTSALNLGFGGGLAFGYRLDRHLRATSIASGCYYQYSLQNLPSGNTGGYFSYVPLEAVLNYNFGEGSFRPYVSFGFGAAFNTYSLTNSSVQGNALQANVYKKLLSCCRPLSAFFKLFHREPLFLWKLEWTWTSGRMAAQSDSMMEHLPMFIPIQAGLNLLRDLDCLRWVASCDGERKGEQQQTQSQNNNNTPIDRESKPGIRGVSLVNDMLRN